MTFFRGRPIVVPIDFGDQTPWPIETALALADTPTNVTVVHVAPDLNVMEPGVMWAEISDAARVEQLTGMFRNRFPQFGGLQFVVLFGDAGHEIAKFAAKIDAGLVVMPSHGRTGLKHLLIGSVAERVVRFAHCPVLVLRN